MYLRAYREYLETLDSLKTDFWLKQKKSTSESAPVIDATPSVPTELPSNLLPPGEYPKLPRKFLAFMKVIARGQEANLRVSSLSVYNFLMAKVGSIPRDDAFLVSDRKYLAWAAPYEEFERTHSPVQMVLAVFAGAKQGDPGSGLVLEPDYPPPPPISSSTPAVAAKLSKGKEPESSAAAPAVTPIDPKLAAKRAARRRQRHARAQRKILAQTKDLRTKEKLLAAKRDVAKVRISYANVVKKAQTTQVKKPSQPAEKQPTSNARARRTTRRAASSK
jgi:hypothetical protein